MVFARKNMEDTTRIAIFLPAFPSDFPRFPLPVSLGDGEGALPQFALALGFGVVQQTA